jgi:hypothetical protein
LAAEGVEQYRDIEKAHAESADHGLSDLPKQYAIVDVWERLASALGQQTEWDENAARCLLESRSRPAERDGLRVEMVRGLCRAGHGEIATAICRRIDGPWNRALGWLSIADSCHRADNPSQTLEAFNQARDAILQTEQPRAILIELWCDFAQVAGRAGQPALAEVGWRTASQVAEHAEPELERDSLFRDIATNATKTGADEIAKESLSRVSKQGRESAHGALALAWAERGDYTRAAASLGAIKRPNTRGLVLARMADLAAGLGQEDKRDELLEQAYLAALEESDARMASSLVRGIVQRRLNWRGAAGIEPWLRMIRQPSKAAGPLDRMEEERDDAEILAQIPSQREEASRAYQRAVAEAKSLGQGPWGDAARATIARSQTRIGWRVEAKSTADLIKDSAIRCNALGYLCYAWMAAGNWDTAVNLWEEVESQDEKRGDIALLNLAVGALDGKRVPWAMAILEEMRDVYWRATAVYYVVRAWAPTADVRDVRAWIKKQKEPWERALGLLALAECETEARWKNRPSMINP